MDPIGGLDKLTELIRRKSTQVSADADKTQANKNAATEAVQSQPVASLEQQIQLKIKQLQQVSASKATLRRAVIETILAREFSAEQLRNEPKFAALVERVQQHVESEPEVLRAFEKFVKKSKI